MKVQPNSDSESDSDSRLSLWQVPDLSRPQNLRLLDRRIRNIFALFTVASAASSLALPSHLQTMNQQQQLLGYKFSKENCEDDDPSSVLDESEDDILPSSEFHHWMKFVCLNVLQTMVRINQVVAHSTLSK